MIAAPAGSARAAPLASTITEPAYDGRTVNPADVHMEATGYSDRGSSPHASRLVGRRPVRRTQQPDLDTSAVDPSGSGGIARASFVATGDGTLFRARLLNDTGGPVALGLRWSDTTQFSPAWSTTGSYDTFFSFLNTTSGHLAGSLTLFDPAGVVLSILELSIPGGRTAAVNTVSLGVDRNRTGSAKLIHHGPPGAILAEAAIANFGLSPAYVQPVKFQAVREAR